MSGSTPPLQPIVSRWDKKGCRYRLSYRDKLTFSLGIYSSAGFSAIAPVVCHHNLHYNVLQPIQKVKCVMYFSIFTNYDKIVTTAKVHL
jgi:hypothetical protein